MFHLTFVQFWFCLSNFAFSGYPEPDKLTLKKENRILEQENLKLLTQIEQAVGNFEKAEYAVGTEPCEDRVGWGCAPNMDCFGIYIQKCRGSCGHLIEECKSGDPPSNRCEDLHTDCGACVGDMRDYNGTPKRACDFVQGQCVSIADPANADWRLLTVSSSDKCPVSGTYFDITDGMLYCEINENGCITDGAGDYNNGEMCEFTVKQDGKLNVPLFQVEAADWCEYDAFTIESVAFCGNFSPNGRFVQEGMKMSWKTDGSETEAGFEICWTEQPTSEYFEITDGILFCEIDEDGCITDGNGVYGNNEECVITVKRDGKLDVLEFDVEYEVDCDFDAFIVDGLSYCGSDSPDGVIVEAGQEMRWKSDISARQEGFKICWEENAVVDAPQPTCMGGGCGVLSGGCITSDLPCCVKDVCVTNEAWNTANRDSNLILKAQNAQLLHEIEEAVGNLPQIEGETDVGTFVIETDADVINEQRVFSAYSLLEGSGFGGNLIVWIFCFNWSHVTIKLRIPWAEINI
eukprot:TRINITY_DN46_c0_g1_i9.p1 TRINITY_DN46_c0_g1~~TRINITY_DN46_c0_g1_i9.p1  ORF type:complete len:518 (+),score=95.37 TRINITY_DN46_c0_g1_i9:86-1639(+)